MALPRWLEVGFGELQRGVSEVPGPASSPRISIYLVGCGAMPSDETPWCAAFVNHCLQSAGLNGTEKPNARSYLSWGQPTEPKLGAIAVLWRGTPDGWQGHVGFFLDQGATSVYLLGGNQGDRVSVAAYPRDRILGYRWPTS